MRAANALHGLNAIEVRLGVRRQRDAHEPRPAEHNVHVDVGHRELRPEELLALDHELRRPLDLLEKLRHQRWLCFGGSIEQRPEVTMDGGVDVADIVDHLVVRRGARRRPPLGDGVVADPRERRYVLV